MWRILEIVAGLALCLPLILSACGSDDGGTLDSTRGVRGAVGGDAQPGGPGAILGGNPGEGIGGQPGEGIGGQPGGGAGPGRWPRRAPARFDTNSDGKISDAELDAFFTRTDLNSDAALSLHEWLVDLPEPVRWMGELGFGRLDRDQSSNLSREELQDLTRVHSGEGNAGPTGSPGQPPPGAAPSVGATEPASSGGPHGGTEPAPTPR